MTLSLTFSQELFQTKCVRTAQIIAIFSDFCYFEIKPDMRDVLAKMRECGREAKMRDFPHDCGTVDTYGIQFWYRQVSNQLWYRDYRGITFCLNIESYPGHEDHVLGL